jgi:Trypsin-like peptidase domain
MLMPQYAPIAWGSEVTEIAMPMVSGSDESDLSVLGTAVLVAPKLVLAAEHVIAEIFHQFTGAAPAKATGELPFGVQLIQTWKGPETTIRWDVMHYWMADPLDIAVLGIEPAQDLPSDFRWSPPRLDVLPPSVGSQIKACGYPASQVRLEGEEAKIRLQPHAASGAVQEIHPQFRDTFRMKFPCFRTNARFDGAMSGGPVFNERGRLVGLVSSNLPPFEEGEEHVSYVSLLWPVMGIFIESDVLPEKCTTGTYPLLDVAHAGLMKVRNADRVTVPESPALGHAHLRL